MSTTRSMASARPGQHAAQIPTTVHDPSVTPVCVCIYGERALPAARLHALMAQLPSEATLLLCGASAPLNTPEAALREPGVIGDDADAALATARRLQPGRHIVLLRGDADLPPLAVARLLRAIAQTDALAVGALDNLDHARSPLPSSWSAEATPQRIDALCHAYARRAAFDTVSVSPLLSIWHGERLAQRATTQPFSHSAAGLRLLTVDHLYVGSDRDLRPLADVVADPRDPAPPSPLAELRIELAAALASRIHPDYDGLDARPVVLHILHGWGGGAERWVRDLASSWNTVHHLVLIARGSHRRRCHGEWLELHLGSLDGPPLRRVALAAPIADTTIAHAGYRQFLHEVIAGRGVDAIVVSSLIGHSLDAVRSGLPTLRVVHDHYPLWPVLHRDFGDPTLDFDDNQLDGDLAAQREFANTDPAHWKILRDATVASMLAAGTQLIAPSQSALRNELRLAPELAVLPQHVIGHGLAPWPHADAQLTEPPTRTRLRLVVPGRIRSGKGGDLLQRIIPALSDYADVFLLGAGSEGHLFFGQSGVHVLLDYDRDTLPELLAGIRADAALLVPTVAETFGYTLSELRDLGLPVIATRVGALAERIQDGEDGFLVDANAMAILQRIASLDGDRESLARVRQTLMTRREPGLQAMASAYAALLALPTHALARTPLVHTGTMNMQLAAALTALERANAGQHSLQSQLVALNEESARRGDWGHALDRQLEKTRHELEERSRWALQLDDRNQRQEQQIQQLVAVANERAAMLASRSWRITAPLRTMTTGLRDLRTRLAFRSARLRAVLSRVRGSLRQHGLSGTWSRILRELRGRPGLIPAQLYADPPSDFSPFALASSTSPRVSIIIPIHNKIAYTVACLRSLGDHAGATPFEVIVVDDCSSDDSAEKLAQISGIRVLRNEENLGFVGSCNAGAALATAEFVLFLNNDTLVTPDWLQMLLRCFEECPDAGLVGARLVYPDGRLQEAGGIVFNDGSGWNYGRFENPDDARFGFRREVDYCSGAAIMLRRALFQQLGCFDQRYAPAYYEDTDLAFGVRAAGLKVYYEPRSTVIHFEGISAGTDTGSGMKRYQVINREKFLAKWHDVLEQQPAPGTPIHLAATHRAGKRVLIIDATTPMPDHDSGSLRMVNLMRVLGELGCQVSFMADNRAWIEHYTEALQALGVEVLYHPYVNDPVALFRERGAEFDAIVLSRHYVAAGYVGLARLYAPQARLVFDTVDLHYLREQRAAELSGKTELARQAVTTRAQELKIMRECDVTLVVSPAEQAILAIDAPGVHVDVLSNVHEVYGCRKPFTEREDLVFIGGFQHPPNTDAVLWFVHEALPAVRLALPDVRFHVIGSKVPREILELENEHVRVHGFVEDIAPFMDGCRISLAPLRYGAGVKGKVNMAMSYGLPVVATTVAVEGMHVRFGEDVLVADDGPAFARHVIALYRDEALWDQLSANGLANVLEHFSFDAAATAIRRIIGV